MCLLCLFQKQALTFSISGWFYGANTSISYLFHIGACHQCCLCLGENERRKIIKNHHVRGISCFASLIFSQVWKSSNAIVRCIGKWREKYRSWLLGVRFISTSHFVLYCNLSSELVCSRILRCSWPECFTTFSRKSILILDFLFVDVMSVFQINSKGLSSLPLTTPNVLYSFLRFPYIPKKVFTWVESKTRQRPFSFFHLIAEVLDHIVSSSRGKDERIEMEKTDEEGEERIEEQAIGEIGALEILRGVENGNNWMYYIKKHGISGFFSATWLDT